jgi:ribosomal protein S20
MIMMGNRKKYVSQILGDDPRGVSKETPLHTIANELIEAIHANDTEAVVACLKAAYTHCQSGESHEPVE